VDESQCGSLGSSFSTPSRCDWTEERPRDVSRDGPRGGPRDGSRDGPRGRLSFSPSTSSFSSVFSSRVNSSPRTPAPTGCTSAPTGCTTPPRRGVEPPSLMPSLKGPTRMLSKLTWFYQSVGYTCHKHDLVKHVLYMIQINLCICIHSAFRHNGTI